MTSRILYRPALDAFARTFDAELRRRGETAQSLSLWAGAPSRGTLRLWRAGRKRPLLRPSLTFLENLEERWALPTGTFTARLDPSTPMRLSRHFSRLKVCGEAKIPLPVLAWHVPEDFDRRSAAEREAIDAWLEATFLGPDDPALRWRSNGEPPYAFAFPVGPSDVGDRRVRARKSTSARRRLKPPPRLLRQWTDLHAFASTPLLPPGRQRDRRLRPGTLGIWADVLGTLFGFLARVPTPGRPGRGLEPAALGFGHLVFPAVWRAYVEARTQRRGAGSRSDVNLILIGLSLLRNKSGWLRQSEALAYGLKPLPGLVSTEEVRAAQQDWAGTCDRNADDLRAMARDLRRRVGARYPTHEPVAVVLRHPRPLALYLTIADEVLAHGADGAEQPQARARRLQFHLMLRIALHTGFRKGVLRRLLVCPPGQEPTPLEALHRARRGALFWNPVRNAWEIVVPAPAFKNADSLVFHDGPHRATLPDAGGLYAHLRTFLAESRPALLDRRADDGVLFVNPHPRSRTELTAEAFHKAWRRGMALYGVRNPWTGRGAIAGLRPHGPHAVRAIIATHILKQTGSVDLASFALQDRPRTVEVYYAHLVSAERSRLVAEALKDVWSGAPAAAAPDAMGQAEPWLANDRSNTGERIDG